MEFRPENSSWKLHSAFLWGQGKSTATFLKLCLSHDAIGTTSLCGCLHQGRGAIGLFWGWWRMKFLSLHNEFSIHAFQGMPRRQAQVPVYAHLSRDEGGP